MTDRTERRDDRWDLARLRAGLIAGTAGTDLEAGGLSLRVSDLPLFAPAADGRPRQVVRVWARADAAPRELTFQLRPGGRFAPPPRPRGPGTRSLPAGGVR